MSDPGSLAAAFAGIDVAYYLIHSLGSDDFEQAGVVGMSLSVADG